MTSRGIETVLNFLPMLENFFNQIDYHYDVTDLRKRVTTIQARFAFSHSYSELKKCLSIKIPFGIFEVRIGITFLKCVKEMRLLCIHYIEFSEK